VTLHLLVQALVGPREVVGDAPDPLVKGFPKTCLLKPLQSRIDVLPHFAKLV
jgi:hypothetical protein